MSLDLQEEDWEVKKFSKTFTIENFLAKRATLKHSVKGPKFQGANGLEGFIKVYPRGETGQKGFAAYLRISAVPSGLKSVAIDDFSVVLQGCKRTPTKEIRMTNICMEAGEETGFIQDPEPNSYIPVTVSGKLIVKVEFRISQTENEMLPDSYVIVSSEGRQFHMAKSLLETRLPQVIHKFKSQPGRPATNRLDVKFDGDTVATLMEFLYTNEISTPATFALLKLADKWQLKRLVVICAKQMADNLSVDNVATSMLIAIRWNISELKDAADDFIDNHKCDAIDIVVAGCNEQIEAESHSDSDSDVSED